MLYSSYPIFYHSTMALGAYNETPHNSLQEILSYVQISPQTQNPQYEISGPSEVKLSFNIPETQFTVEIFLDPSTGKGKLFNPIVTEETHSVSNFKNENPFIHAPHDSNVPFHINSYIEVGAFERLMHVEVLLNEGNMPNEVLNISYPLEEYNWKYTGMIRLEG